MNREDIIRLAQKADFGDGIVEFIGVQKFERFFKAAYAAGVAIEREAIVALANDMRYWDDSEALIKAIQARK